MKRGLQVLVLCVALGAMASTAGAWYPSTPQVEFATATW